jgi:hypothetical protein
MPTIWERIWSKKARDEHRGNVGKIQGNVVGQGFGDIFDKYGALGADADGNRNSKAIGRGDQFSNTQLAEMQFNHDEAQVDRDWNERMYNMYQSPEAQMRQYQEAGLNPALMYQGGVDINGLSGGSAASVSGAVGGENPQSGFERVMGVMSQFLNMLTGASHIGQSVVELKNQTAQTNSSVGLQDADADLKRAQTEQTQVQTNNSILDGELKKLELSYKKQFYDLDIEEQKERINNLKKQGEKILSDIDVNHSVIDLNGAQIDLTRGLTNKADKECALLTSQTLLTNLEAEKLQKVMPFVQAREAAALELTYATTEAQKADKQKKLAEADEALMAVAKEETIINSGYYEERVKGMKSDRRRAITDCVVGNICDIVKTGVGVVTGTAALTRSSRNPIAAPMPKPNELVSSTGAPLYGVQ